MTGKLDEISFQIGKLSTAVENVSDQIGENKQVAEQRHSANQARLSAIEKVLTPLDATVKALSPIVEGMRITRWRISGALAVGSFLFAGLGWIIMQIATKAITWAFSALRF